MQASERLKKVSGKQMKITIEKTPVGYLVILQTDSSIYQVITNDKDKIKELIKRILEVK